MGVRTQDVSQGFVLGAPANANVGEYLPCKEPKWGMGWHYTLCAGGLHHHVSLACSGACFQLHPQAETPGAEAQQHLSPWGQPGLEHLIQPRTPPPAYSSPSCSPGPVPSSLGFFRVLGPWSVAGQTKDPLPTHECMEEVRHQQPFHGWGN